MHIYICIYNIPRDDCLRLFQILALLWYHKLHINLMTETSSSQNLSAFETNLVIRIRLREPDFYCFQYSP
jgi:hypothetical protein